MDSRAQFESQFETEEFFRYAAECRRMARLARRDLSASKIATGAAMRRLNYFDWIKQGLMAPSAHVTPNAFVRVR